jgi:hypothetical protein
MSHKSSYDNVDGIITTVFTDAVDVNDIISMMKDVTKLAVENKCYLWLNDFTKANVEVNIMGLFKLATSLKNIENTLGDNLFQVKRAVIRNPEMKENKFMETVAANRGQILKVFDNTDDAKKWLKGE